MVPIFGYCILSMPLLKHFSKDPPGQVEALNQYSLTEVSYSAYIKVKFCSYNPSSNFNFYLWNGVLLFQQPLHNHHARLLITTLQGCKHLAQIATALGKPCHNLTKLHQGCYNLVISIWVTLKELWFLTLDVEILCLTVVM